jgi:ABC-2 type transport system permease protein
MNIIFKIAKTELRNLFYSPIAWFLMIALLIQCAINYMGYVEYNVKTMEMGGEALKYMSNITGAIFYSDQGLFANVMENLYLYIPLLTMGLISREINGGTIKLLYSSPVRIWQIVAGKYLAMMVFSLVLVGIVGIFMTSAVLHIQAVDVFRFVAAAFGLYLLLCAYSAIGLFMSSLTIYQVVAAISTFIMIGVLSYIGNLWQEYDVVRDLTYFLSLSGRTNHLLAGLITTKDVIYFIIIIYIFLALAILRLDGALEVRPFIVKLARYAIVIFSALLVGYISSRPGMIGYLDLTVNKSNTLSPNARRIIKELGNDVLEITVYNNLLGDYNFVGLPKQRNNFLSFWERYVRFKPDISFRYVDYYDRPYDATYVSKDDSARTLKERASIIARNMDLDLNNYQSPEQIRKVIDLQPELNRFVMQLRYKGRTTFLRIYNDQRMFPGETEVCAALERLLMATIPRIAFATGDLERSIYKKGDREYQNLTSLKTFRYSLVNQGFDVDTLLLKNGDIPDGIGTLVIADPRSELSPDVQAKVGAYIGKGGNLLIAGEPGKQSVLNPLLQPLGVRLMDGIIVQQSKDFSPDLVLNKVPVSAAGISKPLAYIADDGIPVSTPGVTALSYEANGTFRYQHLLMTDASHSWLKLGKLVADSAEVFFSAGAGDQMSAYPTALALSRNINGKEQRIIITGDADFISNSELARANMQISNFQFNAALYNWLNYGTFPIDTSIPRVKDNRMRIGSTTVAWCKVLFIWVLPAILLAFGTILLIRRKRK